MTALYDLKKEFPIFSLVKPNGHPLSYLDTAATSQTPRRVIERMQNFYAREHANIHRGAYGLSAEATEQYEAARDEVASFLGAHDRSSIIFTRGATAGINLVARSLENWVEPGDTILLSLLEHHSNIVPWQLLAKRRGVDIAWVDIHEDGSLNWESLKEKLQTLRPKLLGITGLANSLGTPVDIPKVVELARETDTAVLVDGAQSAPHQLIQFDEWGADFLVFAGHKVYGPTGIGVLAVKPKWYPLMEPYEGGGGMIGLVTTGGSSWAEPPYKFEAGTPPIAEALGLAEALRFVKEVGSPHIVAHEARLMAHYSEGLKNEPGVILHGPITSGNPQVSIISYSIEGVHPHDVATIADTYGVQVRAGHHCAQPTLKRLGLPATVRISFGMYTGEEELEPLLKSIREARKLFA